MRAFVRRSPAEQATICNAWADGARAAGHDVEVVRIYQVVRTVSERDGDRGVPPRTRSLRITCGDGSVHPTESS